VAATLVHTTRWLTLEAGDVVMTGAPGTFTPVEAGDVVEITLGGIGTLTNRIV
jgi:2-keto-4-pentenoate hydratase/2-oxohepta-3-ene-1,7-dioic acid hydratase in catechol pathway